MNIEEIREHCLSLPDVTEDSAFGPEMILFRLKGKIFAALDLDRPDLMVVKCDPDEGTDLRDRYAGIRPAWHWNKQHWVEILFNEDVDDQMIRNLATRAYHLVRTALPKKTLYHFPECPPDWDYQHFACLDTVMNYLKTPEAEALPHDTLLVTTDFQTAGRGQRGNHWEAAKEANLLLGLRLRGLHFPARHQFALTQVASLAAAQALAKYLGSSVSIKWPNDLYYQDRKIGGMLFEHTLSGDRIGSTIIGIGLNVNQTAFASDAPNPTSIRLELGKEVDRAAVMRGFVKAFRQWWSEMLEDNSQRLDKHYRAAMYRREGEHPYRDDAGTFTASFHDLTPEGLLQLRDSEGRLRTYAFKEVTFLP